MRRRRSFSFYLVFVWSFGLTALSIAGLTLTARFAPAAARDIVTVGVWQALPLLLGSSVVLALHLPGESGARALALRPTFTPLILLGAALGLALYLPVQALTQYAEQVRSMTELELAQRALLYRTDTAGRVLLLMFFGACLVPTAQEIFFHGAVYGALRREFSPVVSAVVSSLGFAVASQNIRQWPVLLLIGSVGSFLRVTSGSLLVPLTLNVSFNAVILIALATGVASATEAPSWPWQAMLASWLAAMGLIALVGRVSQASDAAAAARAEDDRD